MHVFLHHVRVVVYLFGMRFIERGSCLIFGSGSDQGEPNQRMVKLRSYYMETGTYSNEGIAYTRYVQITILDRAAGTVIHEETLIGSAPFSISEDQSCGGWLCP
jgi:hypothetical protein